MVDVADKNHTGVRDHLDASRKTAVGHVILHDLDRVRVADLDSGDLVKRDGVPEADDPDAFAGVVVEQGGFGGLTAAE
jgi:hypothetical protein